MRHAQRFANRVGSRVGASTALFVLWAAACAGPSTQAPSADAGQGGAVSTGGTIVGKGGQVTGGGSVATGGVAAATGGTKAPLACGTGKKNDNPFNCAFAWGAPAENQDPSKLDFVSTWIGDEPNGGLSSWSATATNSGESSQSACGDCALVKSLAGSDTLVVFYTYFIGFQACKQANFCDCDLNPNSPNLCTNGAQWIRDNRDVIVNAYGQYAKAVNKASPDKPVIWWLEGDFIQYSYTTQKSPLKYDELGALTREITCAIKANQPSAIVAMNHSPWITDPQSVGFWAAMPKDVLDLVWVQGAGDQDAFIKSGIYNETSSRFSWLHTFTGLKIMAETSFGSPDRWSTTTLDNVNARIADGVIGVHVNFPTGGYPGTTSAFTSLASTCK